MVNRRRTRKRTFQKVSISLIIPNMITVGAICASLTAVRFALEGRFKFALFAILLAVILDGLDGHMARLLKASSKFGEQMDSLADVISFGVAPGLILYYWILNNLAGPLGGYGWVACLFYVTCCALRLARFNSRLTQLPPYAYNFFQGVPSPAGAGLALLPIIFSFVVTEQEWGNVVIPPIAVAIWLVAIGLLMISEFPTFSLKRIGLPKRLLLPLLGVMALGFSAFTGAPWLSLFIILSIYLLSFPVSLRSYRKLRLAAEALEKGE